MIVKAGSKSDAQIEAYKAAKADIDALTVADITVANSTATSGTWANNVETAVKANTNVAAILSEATKYSGATVSLNNGTVANTEITAGSDSAQKAGDVLSYDIVVTAAGYTRTLSSKNNYVPADYVYVNDVYTWLQDEMKITSAAATGTDVKYGPDNKVTINGCTVTFGTKTESDEDNLSISGKTVTAGGGGSTPTITYNVKVEKGSKKREDNYTITKENGAATYKAALDDGTAATA